MANLQLGTTRAKTSASVSWNLNMVWMKLMKCHDFQSNSLRSSADSFFGFQAPSAFWPREDQWRFSQNFPKGPLTSPTSRKRTFLNSSDMILMSFLKACQARSPVTAAHHSLQASTNTKQGQRENPSSLLLLLADSPQAYVVFCRLFNDPFKLSRFLQWQTLTM